MPPSQEHGTSEHSLLCYSIAGEIQDLSSDPLFPYILKQTIDGTSARPYRGILPDLEPTLPPMGLSGQWAIWPFATGSLNLFL